MENAMQSVNMLQAKSSLSRLVEAIEQGQEREIVIAPTNYALLCQKPPS